MFKYKSALFAMILFAMAISPLSAQPADPSYFYGFPIVCERHDYTPKDVSGQNLPIVIDNTTGSGVNNSSFCATSVGFVYFQFLVTMPTTSDTHQVRISLPFVTYVLYDQPVTVGAVICPSLTKTIYADVTPATVIKLFLTGDTSAATYAEVSGCMIGISGMYYLH